MSDVVVTVPKRLWADWLAEGELPGQRSWPCYFCEATGWGGGCNLCDGHGEAWAGQIEWDFFLGGHPPDISPGERVYVVAHGRLRGYAPLVRVRHGDPSVGERGFSLVRRSGAVACTIDEPIRGFQGYRYRWWDLSAERPFPDWQTAGVS